MNERPIITYEPAPENEYWWCNTHKRRATHICFNSWQATRNVCAPNLSGIMMPCEAVRLDDKVEVIE